MIDPVIVRSSVIGQIIYFASSKRYFRFPEELDGFVLPEKYLKPAKADKSSISGQNHIDNDNDSNHQPNHRNTSDEGSLNPESNNDDDYIFVDWYGDADEEKPANWRLSTKILVMFEIVVLTLVVYQGVYLSVPAIEVLQQEFGVRYELTILPISLFLLALGIGPMVLGPMSEDPAIGRVNVYMVCLLIYIVLQIPSAIVGNIAGFIVLRFLSGIFASPPVANGGASIADMFFNHKVLPIALTFWSSATIIGPILGPIFGGLFVQFVDWRWAFWFQTILSGCLFLFLSVLLPETNHEAILYRRAYRLRTLTGNPKITTRLALTNSRYTLKRYIWETLYRPFVIGFSEPVVLLLNIYTGLIFGCMFTWYAAFPRVFSNMYGFTIIATAAVNVGMITGCLVSMVLFTIIVIYRDSNEDHRARREPEKTLDLAILGAIFFPLGVLLFGWTACNTVHWTVSAVMSGVFIWGEFLIFVSANTYLFMAFEKYVASVMAGNGLFKNVCAMALSLGAGQMYDNLRTPRFPVAWGCTVMAFTCLAVGTVPAIVYFWGHKMRSRSKYANQF